ncbi:MAG TPA: YlxR family protein [bacterium]|nr:YlxR family protein [bacterium]
MPKVRRVPQRQCVACGQVRPKRELVRIVRTPAGDVRVDATGKVSGRGAYVCPDDACVDRAVRGGRLAGALAQPLAEDIGQRLRETIVRPAPARAPVVRRVSLREQRTRSDGETEGSW